MNKEQVDICLEMLGLFNKASFNFTGVECVKAANTLKSFGKMISDAKSIKKVEDESILKTKSKQSKKSKK